MEKKQPQKCTPERKAQIAMAAISGQMTVQEIMNKYGVSKSAVYTWKHELEQKAASLFGGKVENAPMPDSREQQKRIDNLHRKIGELEMELDLLSSVLSSKIAIQINIGIMRAFVSIRKMVTANPVVHRLTILEKNFEELKQELEDIFADYNDINEETRMQLDAINTALADLQAINKSRKSRKPIGFNPETKRPIYPTPNIYLGVGGI